jgi:hypothetical protein
MKYLYLFLIPSLLFGATLAPSNYALINAEGKVIEVFVATPDIAATYPQVAKDSFPDAIKCVPANNTGIGWTYDSTTNTFTAPIAETTVDVSKAPPAFTLQDPTPVVTTNNAVALPVVTTNNLSILTTNNSQ